MAEQNSVIALYDERMLAHEPDIEVPFLPGRMDKRVRSLLSGLGVPWKYPEHPARLTAIRRLLDIEPVRARGFCLFNNVAVAAAHARAALGCQRVMIVDWDAHHGNGTQDIFWADPDVLFFDIHRAAPFYPGTGSLEEVGVGLGDGANVNVPLPADAGDAAYLKTFREILVPAAEWLRPDLILVSTGFDPHSHDLALNVSYDGFSAMTGILQRLARRHCGGRLVFVLEGGYNLISLSRGVRAVLQVLAGDEPREPGLRGLAEVEAAAAFHRGAFVTEPEASAAPPDAAQDGP